MAAARCRPARDDPAPAGAGAERPVSPPRPTPGQCQGDDLTTADRVAGGPSFGSARGASRGDHLQSSGGHFAAGGHAGKLPAGL